MQPSNCTSRVSDVALQMHQPRCTISPRMLTAGRGRAKQAGELAAGAANTGNCCRWLLLAAVQAGNHPQPAARLRSAHFQINGGAYKPMPSHASADAALYRNLLPLQLLPSQPQQLLLCCVGAIPAVPSQPSPSCTQGTGTAPATNNRCCRCCRLLPLRRGECHCKVASHLTRSWGRVRPPPPPRRAAAAVCRS